MSKAITTTTSRNGSGNGNGNGGGQNGVLSSKTVGKKAKCLCGHPKFRHYDHLLAGDEEASTRAGLDSPRRGCQVSRCECRLTQIEIEDILMKRRDA
jgi:hypothetical protein